MKIYLTRYLLLILFFVLNIQMKAQEATDSSMLIKVNDIISYADFEDIRSYVWASGNRRTYCPNYTNNPYLELSDINTEIYFNPSAKSGELTKADYNIMYIVSRLKDLPFNYYLYLTDMGAVYLYDYNKYLKDANTKGYVLEQLKQIIEVTKEKTVNSF